MPHDYQSDGSDTIENKQTIVQIDISRIEVEVL